VELQHEVSESEVADHKHACCRKENVSHVWKLALVSGAAWSVQICAAFYPLLYDWPDIQDSICLTCKDLLQATAAQSLKDQTSGLKDTQCSGYLVQDHPEEREGRTREGASGSSARLKIGIGINRRVRMPYSKPYSCKMLLKCRSRGCLGPMLRRIRMRRCKAAFGIPAAQRSIHMSRLSAVTRETTSMAVLQAGVFVYPT
jgi:hypothetical protein